MKRWCFGVGAMLFLGWFVVMLLAADDPRVAQILAVRDSLPPLPDNVKALLTSAAEAIPTIPDAPPPPPPAGLGVCGESKEEWHPPVVNGCQTRHEHGDAPPAYATDFSQVNFGHGVIYGGDETSGPMEQGMKHEAFKGIIIPSVGVSGGQAYLRYHAASNPMDRSARDHSFEWFYRDRAGAVSFRQGLYNTGDPNPANYTSPTSARYPRRLGDNGTRPIMLVRDRQTQDIGEQWYMFGYGGLRMEFSLTILNATTFYIPGESATAMDQSTWQPTGNLGLSRRAEYFNYRPPVAASGWFCQRKTDGAVNPQGTVAGPSACAGDFLPQYIAPTMFNDVNPNVNPRRIEGLVQKSFPGQGVQIPN